jgi:hypothetical protein
VTSRLLFALLPLLFLGCPKSGESNTSGKAGASWVVFEIYEAGTGNALPATVWPQGMDDDFDNVVQGAAGAETRFEGIGRREGGGYALTFTPGSSVNLMVWSPGHELKRVEQKLRKGENLVAVELKRTVVEDDRVPERIRLDAMENLPTQGPQSGS